VTAAIDIRGLRKSYGQIHALAGLDLEIPARRIVGVVGPNGAGKTTLFSVLCGFIRADAGEVRLGGQTLRPGRRLPVRVAALPQDAQLHGGITVKRHLIYYAKLDGLEGDTAVKQAGKTLHQVGLPEIWSRTPRTLSHGMRKRACIAQCLIGTPDLLILDEPLEGLDSEAARAIRLAIREAAKDRTVLLSSHNLEAIQELCHEVVILNQGRVVSYETMTRIGEARGQVHFRLANAPSEAFLSVLRALPHLKRVEWDAGELRLRIHFDPAEKAADEASSELVQVFVREGVPFTSMDVGQRLEDVVRQQTKG
jgi:ABC-2 type transport system ATP-binding protein